MASGKKEYFIVVLASMNLMECHRMAICREPMCGHVDRKGHSHESVYNFVEEAERATDHLSSRVCQFN